MYLADSLRCCVLGDPMQAIFGFKGNALVDWDTDVLASFGDAGELKTPWRWINAGEKEFGEWPLSVRKMLLAGGSIDLASAPKNVIHIVLDGSDDHALRLKACLTKAPTADGSVLIIADSTKPAEQRRFARQTPGALVAENVDMRDLVDFARGFDLNASNALFRLVQFACQIMVNVGPDDLLARVKSLQAGKTRKDPTETEQTALAFANDPSYVGASALLAAINKDAGVRTHRPPVLRACHKMFQLCGLDDGPSLYDAAVEVREQSRLVGRPLAKRTVGSTLLLKGLEADVAVILNPEVMDHNHLCAVYRHGQKAQSRLRTCDDLGGARSIRGMAAHRVGQGEICPRLDSNRNTGGTSLIECQSPAQLIVDMSSAAVSKPVSKDTAESSHRIETAGDSVSMAPVLYFGALHLRLRAIGRIMGGLIIQYAGRSPVGKQLELDLSHGGQLALWDKG